MNAPAQPHDVAARIAALLAPVVARASEKAEMLVDEIARSEGDVAIRIDGLAPTVRRLAARYGEAKVEAAAVALMARLRDWGSTRERVT